MQFTEATISALQSHQSPYTKREEGSRGFTVMVLPSSRKTFYFERVVAGRKLRRHLGRWPERSVEDVRLIWKRLAAQSPAELTDRADNHQTYIEKLGSLEGVRALQG